MAEITLESVEKVYPNGFVAARDLSLGVADGELMVLVGPSGSGKSTVLRMIAGLEQVSGGRIRIGGRDVTGLPPQERDVAMVFQSYALYPHMTVRENLGFGLRMRKVAAGEIARRVHATAESLGLAGLLDRKPAQLSGGQRQRVALGRAIVREPLAFLFDEPLSNLDARLRVETRAELARLHRRLAATMVYVTHDQVEAMTLGDRVAVMRQGALQQVAPPLVLYHRPANRFVAEFIGSPGMNMIEGRVTTEGGARVFESAALRVVLPSTVLGEDGGGVVLGIRPHDLLPVGEGEPANLEAEAGVVEPLGNEQVIHLSTPGAGRLLAVLPPEPRVVPGERLRLRFLPNALHLFRAGGGERIEGA